MSFYVEDQSRKVVRVKSSVTVKIICQRCLVAMPLCLECDTILCIVWTEDEASTLPKHLDPWVVEEDKGDAIQLVEDELLLALPFVAYHNEDKCNSLTSSSNTDADCLDNNIKLDFKKNEKVYKIAYHSPCSMQHGQKVHQQPIDLIKRTGNEVLNIPEGHLCCGSAGTYNILQQKIAKTLLKNKVENINKIKPDFISTGNIGCMTQIASGIETPIVHTVEVIDWLTGGPKPIKLNNL